MRQLCQRFQRHLLAVFCIFALSLIFSGCIPQIKMPWMVRPDAPCVLDAGMTDREILQHVNKNVMQLLAWQSNEVKIRTHGPGSVPISLSANIAVEAPRRFRLVATSILGYEADLGSNNERFWFWMKRSEPRYVYTVQHDRMKVVESRMPIPLKPDWLMQALGVIPIDEGNVSFVPRKPGEQATELSIAEILPNGQNVTRIIKIDNCYGNILSHELYDHNYVLMAKAELGDYRMDAITGLQMPHRISLSWPKSGYGMTLTIGTIEINPQQIPETRWTMPQHDPVMDLASQFERMSRGGNVIPASAENVPNSSVWDDDHRSKLQESGIDPNPFENAGSNKRRENKTPVFEHSSRTKTPWE